MKTLELMKQRRIKLEKLNSLYQRGMITVNQLDKLSKEIFNN